MDTQWLCERLRRYVRSNAAQIETCNDFLAFVMQTPDCFSRSHTAGHVTGSAWITDAARSHVLLTHHAKLDRWLQLGGHVEEDSDLLATAWREAREESGLSSIQPVGDDIFDIDIHCIPPRGAEPEHLHFDARFDFTASRHEIPKSSSESKSVRWVALGDVESLNSCESIQRMVRKTRSLPG